MVLVIQFGELFLFYLMHFTIFPSVVLYCSGDDYYQIWTKPKKVKVRTRIQNYNYNVITKILLPFKGTQFYITHPGFTPRDTKHKLKFHNANTCASTSKHVEQFNHVTGTIRAIKEFHSQDLIVRIDI